MVRTAVVGLLTAALLGQGGAVANTAEYGHTAAPNGVLRPSCHNYPYRFVVKAPTNDWMLETFLVDRRGETIAHGVFGPPTEGRRERESFRFCRWNTVPGTFKIRAKLVYYEDDDLDGHTRWFKPSRFRLRTHR